MSTSDFRERFAAAEATRRWREANAHRPDPRRCDRVIVEALVEYLRTTPGSDALMARLIADATAGLVLQGYPEEHARREVARRLRYMTEPKGIASGSVRGALDRRRYAENCPLTL
ncbi:hypothetical protein SAMN06297251_10465 [Fulvimarina manganoxydans]|uniref:Uncharacterized protein n=1 Tax=Fulvimarina manganoxydans TaxID=937218 RepID=A0A1W2ACB6_9HYPH|nr:hypothetical protein [Fulvimarina manganoxydans]SMC58284.1 hypothetical protein SAMN06297251_10465 [Fulvimarina manganoxydans]